MNLLKTGLYHPSKPKWNFIPFCNLVSLEMGQFLVWFNTLKNHFRIGDFMDRFFFWSSIWPGVIYRGCPAVCGSLIPLIAAIFAIESQKFSFSWMFKHVFTTHDQHIYKIYGLTSAERAWGSAVGELGESSPAAATTQANTWCHHMWTSRLTDWHQGEQNCRFWERGKPQQSNWYHWAVVINWGWASYGWRVPCCTAHKIFISLRVL